MDDVKDRFKGFMKKVNNQLSSSSSGKFKGQGRVLGSSSSIPNNSILNRQSPNVVEPKRNANSSSDSRSNPRPASSSANSDPRRVTDSQENRDSLGKSLNSFDPFDPLITSSKRSQTGYSLNVFECPVCGISFRSEEEVSEHIDSCTSVANGCSEPAKSSELPEGMVKTESGNELAECVGAFVSGGVSEGSIEVVLKLLRNIVREPENAKFRRVRMSNPKIREAIGEVVGGVELLERIGFRLQEEGDEMWAVMEVPSKEHLLFIREAISLLESQKTQELPSTAVNNGSEGTVGRSDELVAPQKIDRQVRVFFSVPESVAAKIELPDSFYNLSIDEIKREADLRKKKIAESQLLIPKSYKEKQAKVAKKRYTNAIIRIQFPDEVVLQGVFLPWERTDALYEFVSSSLKEPGLEFELWHPAVVKRRMIPRFQGQRTPTLDEEDLVPSALIKFKPLETDSTVFTGLSNELLQISEPLKTNARVQST